MARLQTTAAVLTVLAQLRLVSAEEEAGTAVAATCAASQILPVPVAHDVVQCQFTDTTDGVCCYENTTGESTNFLTSCRAQENYLDCSNKCLPSASTWSLEAQGLPLTNLTHPRQGVRMCYTMCLSYWDQCYAYYATASADGSDAAIYCGNGEGNAIAAPIGDTDCLGMPENHCPSQCQGHGNCDMSIDRAAEGDRPAGCECHDGYLGWDCSFEYVFAELPFGLELSFIPTDDITGYCSILNTTCECYYMWFGPRCQVRATPDPSHLDSAPLPAPFPPAQPPRTAPTDLCDSVHRAAGCDAAAAGDLLQSDLHQEEVQGAR